TKDSGLPKVHQIVKAVRAMIHQVKGGSVSIRVTTMVNRAIRGMNAQNVCKNPLILREDHLEAILVQQLTRTLKLGLSNLRASGSQGGIGYGSSGQGSDNSHPE
ncbi:hypothetical protein PanWU01x14_077270, partial [Parasponia andersonii]